MGEAYQELTRHKRVDRTVVPVNKAIRQKNNSDSTKVKPVSGTDKTVRQTNEMSTDTKKQSAGMGKQSADIKKQSAGMGKQSADIKKQSGGTAGIQTTESVPIADYTTAAVNPPAANTNNTADGAESADISRHGNTFTRRIAGGFIDFFNRCAKLRVYGIALVILGVMAAYGWTPSEPMVQKARPMKKYDAMRTALLQDTARQGNLSEPDVNAIVNDDAAAAVGMIPDGISGKDNEISDTQDTVSDAAADRSGTKENTTTDSAGSEENAVTDTASEIFWRLFDGRILSTWADGEDYYVFLPSYAHLVNASVIIREPYRVEVEGRTLDSSSDLSRYAIRQTYHMDIRGGGVSQSRTLTFLRSENIPALYIDTSSGNMDFLHENRENREPVRVALVDQDGSRLYSGVNDTLKGRGQSSWTADKKSYTLRLQKPKSLLGMKSGIKWALISNAYDPTNLRNKLVYDLAGQTGIEWSPECHYVDLYLNGEYVGLYLLSERVETENNRLMLPNDRRHTNFLCKVEIYNRWDTLDQPFLTDNTRTIELVSPEPATELEWNRVRRDVQLLENTILSGNERLLLKYLDLDSWVRRYLIDEISENLDADLASSYFYCIYDGSRPVFYGGPIWDYDGTFQNASPYRNINPEAFVASAAWEADGVPTPWFHALCQYDAFQKRVRELYETEFLPRLNELAGDGIEALYKHIKYASQMNAARWPEMNKQREPLDGEIIQAFLEKRIHFLNQAWIENVKFYTVQAEPYPGQYYLSYSVRAGERFINFPSYDTMRLGNKNDSESTEQDDTVTWYDLETGVVYASGHIVQETVDGETKNVVVYDNPGRIVDKDMILVHWNPRPEVYMGPEPQGTSPVPLSGSWTVAEPPVNSELRETVPAINSETGLPETGALAPSPTPVPTPVPTLAPDVDPARREELEQEKLLQPWRDNSMLFAMVRLEILSGFFAGLVLIDVRRRGKREGHAS